MKAWRIGFLGLAILALLATSVVQHERALFFPDRPADAYPTLRLEDFHRLLVVAPHCDDEVLGAGGLIRAALRRGMEARVVIATAGDGYLRATLMYTHRPLLTARDFLTMGEIRQRESLEALYHLGLSPENVIFLTYPERRLSVLWWQRWEQPDRSPFTKREASPYPRAYRRGTLYRGRDLLEDLLEILESFQPDLIVFPHPNDEHPDHWALNAFVQLAVEIAQARSPGYTPLLLGYLIHYGAYPQPAGLRPSESLLPPRPLDSLGEWLLWPLSTDDVRAKAWALEAYPSQLRVLGSFLRRFVRQNELFMVLGEEPLHNLDFRTLRDGTGEGSPPERGGIALPDPVGDRLPRQVAGGADIAAIHIARMGRYLWVGVETRARPSEVYQYSLRVLAVGPDLKAFTRKYTVRPNQQDAFWTWHHIVQYQIDLEEDGSAPLWIALSAETRRNVPLDWTGWYVLTLND